MISLQCRWHYGGKAVMMVNHHKMEEHSRPTRPGKQHTLKSEQISMSTEPAWRTAKPARPTSLNSISEELLTVVKVTAGSRWQQTIPRLSLDKSHFTVTGIRYREELNHIRTAHKHTPSIRLNTQHERTTILTNRLGGRQTRQSGSPCQQNCKCCSHGYACHRQQTMQQLPTR